MTTDPREERLAFLVLELEGLKAEKRELMKAAKERIDEMQDRVDALARDIRSGQKSLGDIVADLDRTGSDVRADMIARGQCPDCGGPMKKGKTTCGKCDGPIQES